MYKSILALVALNPESHQVIQRAKALSEQFSARLQLLHVVEYVPLTGTEDAMITAPIPIGEELEKQARLYMAKLAQEFELKAEQIAVVTGDLSAELEARSKSDAAHAGVDLVVVGNHSRSGFSAWFNHAEDEVLHRCGCDLLAVKLSD